MAILGDYHTHTVYSRNGKKLHGKGTVLQNAEAAASAGLQELAITDHGFGHYYGVKGEDAFFEFKRECEAAEKSTGVKIYAGLENNLDPKSGKNAKLSPLWRLDERILSELDIVQGGYHAFMGMPSMIGNMMFWTRNTVFGALPTKKLIEKNTLAYKRMIDEYPVDFIGHLNRGILADAVEVAKYARAHGVYIELNGRHKTLKPEEISAMVKAGVEFICNSDAHRPEDVGKMPLSMQLVEQCDIPYELVANWDRLPNFRSKNFQAARARKSVADNASDRENVDCEVNGVNG